MHAEQTTQTRETSGGAGAPCSSLSCKARGVDAHPEREQHAIARGCHQHVTALDGLPDDPHGCRSRRTVHVLESQQPLCPLPGCCALCRYSTCVTELASAPPKSERVTFAKREVRLAAPPKDSEGGTPVPAAFCNPP